MEKTGIGKNGIWFFGHWIKRIGLFGLDFSDWPFWGETHKWYEIKKVLNFASIFFLQFLRERKRDWWSSINSSSSMTLTYYLKKISYRNKYTLFSSSKKFIFFCNNRRLISSIDYKFNVRLNPSLLIHHFQLSMWKWSDQISSKWTS